MKKIAKILSLIAIFAMVVAMVPQTALTANADTEPVVEVSSVTVTATAPKCGQSYGNDHAIIDPDDPVVRAPWFGEAPQSEPSSEELVSPADLITLSDGVTLMDYLWLKEDPNGYHGFSAENEIKTFVGGQKYYFAIVLMSGTVDFENDTYAEAWFSDNCQITVKNGRLVWGEFFSNKPMAPGYEGTEVVPEEELADEEAEAVSDEAEASADDVADEPQKVVTEYFNMYEGVIEVVAEHIPGETVIENVVEKTETTDGSHDEVVYCTECNAELSRVTIVDPRTPKESNDDGVPKTGDDSNAALYIGMMILAFGGAAFVVDRKRKAEKR